MQTTESFINKAEWLYPDSGYDYSRVQYRRALSHVVIVCPDHGPFRTTPDAFLYKRGCKACAAIHPRAYPITRPASERAAGYGVYLMLDYTVQVLRVEPVEFLYGHRFKYAPDARTVAAYLALCYPDGITREDTPGVRGVFSLLGR